MFIIKFTHFSSPKQLVCDNSHDNLVILSNNHSYNTSFHTNGDFEVSSKYKFYFKST